MQTSFVTVFSGSIANQSEQLCNARDLHAALKVETRFDTWITRRIAEYGFEENQDFITVSVKRATGAGKGRTDYHLTLDTAKELAMVEKTEVGRQIRRYFIQCEKELRQTVSHSLPDPYRSRPVAGGLNAEQISVVKAFHRQLVQCAPKDKQAALAIGLWSAVKTKFGVGYKQVAEAHYPEVLSLMARVAVEKGALSGEVLDKEPELPVAALNDYELTRIAQFLSQSYSMMTELYIVQEPMNMLRLPFGQKALQYLKDNLPLLQAVVHGLQRFRPTDPICAPEFNKHMQYLSRAGLPV